MIAPTWNDEFKLPDVFYSVSDIQDYINCIIKSMKDKQQFLLFMLLEWIVLGIKDG